MNQKNNNHTFTPFIPKFGFDDYTRKLYYNNMIEREAFGQPTCTLNEYVDSNKLWLIEQYERFLSE